MTQRILALFIALAYLNGLIGCASANLPKEELIRPAKRPHQIASVELTDGEKIAFAGLGGVYDSTQQAITGTRKIWYRTKTKWKREDTLVIVPLDQIAQIERRRINVIKTVLLMTAATAVMLAVVSVVAASQMEW